MDDKYGSHNVTVYHSDKDRVRMKWSNLGVPIDPIIINTINQKASDGMPIIFLVHQFFDTLVTGHPNLSEQ